MSRMLARLAGIVFAVSSSGAYAAPVTRTFAITVSNLSFVGGQNNPPPFTSVNGQFTVTFDTTMNSGATPLINTLDLPAPYGVGLVYTYQSGLDRLNFGQTPSANNNDGPFNPGSVYFSVQGASTSSPTFRNIINGNFLVTNTAGTSQYNTSNTTISIVPVVPEPAAWGLMILGFGAVGGARRTRRRTLAAA